VSSEAFQNGMKAVMDFLKFLGGTAVQTAVDAVSSLAQALSALFSGDWQGVVKGIGGVGDAAGNALGALLTGESYSDTKKKKDLMLDAWVAVGKETETGLFGFPKKKKFEEYSLETQQKVIAAGGPEKFQNYIKINDGIVSPDGRTIGISPDDWVFAAKNVEDIASAFIPDGTAAGSNVSAPASYVINQSFTVNGGNAQAQAVRAEAYRGTAAALQNNIRNAARIMQLMPGTR
ncbi:MAG: hypothetical protein SOT81_07980, partial [Treponema sp.]|nr:hypothetical protein [Treponema sp.]